MYLPWSLVTSRDFFFKSLQFWLGVKINSIDVSFHKKKWKVSMKIQLTKHRMARANLNKGSFTNYVDKILAFSDHLPPCVDIFYGMNVDKKWAFLDHLPTSSCKRNL